MGSRCADRRSPAGPTRRSPARSAVDREKGDRSRTTREDSAVDGLPAGEGVFLPCSFWLAVVLALQGKADEAREMFELPFAGG
jgi:hypothetical protein